MRMFFGIYYYIKKLLYNFSYSLFLVVFDLATHVHMYWLLFYYFSHSHRVALQWHNFFSHDRHIKILFFSTIFCILVKFGPCMRRFIYFPILFWKKFGRNERLKLEKKNFFHIPVFLNILLLGTSRSRWHAH